MLGSCVPSQGPAGRAIPGADNVPATCWEPSDGMKGELARVYLYMSISCVGARAAVRGGLGRPLCVVGWESRCAWGAGARPLTSRDTRGSYADIFTCCDNDATNGATLKPWLLATILDWHAAFPQVRAAQHSLWVGRRVRVRACSHWGAQSAGEATRHEVVYGIQQNRNPFQDFPAWANQVFLP